MIQDPKRDDQYLIYANNYCGVWEFSQTKIQLSPLTKGILNLLRKNEYGKSRFNDVIQNVYFSGLNYSNNTNEKKSFKLNPFIITNSEK